MAEPKPEFLVIPDPHKVPVTFVNMVTAAGQHMGVVNVSFATANFSPNEKGEVDPDMVMSLRLRMDMGCTEQLYQQLGRIIQQAAAQAQALASTIVTSSASPGKSGKGN